MYLVLSHYWQDRTEVWWQQENYSSHHTSTRNPVQMHWRAKCRFCYYRKVGLSWYWVGLVQKGDNWIERLHHRYLQRQSDLTYHYYSILRRREHSPHY